MPGDIVFAARMERELVWLPQSGMGWRAAEAPVYDKDYFEEYVRRADSEMGRRLTEARLAFVQAHYEGPLVDVGIGCGQFIEARGKGTFGYDVNPEAVAWLKERELWIDPTIHHPFPAATFWDSLEHIETPRSILDWIQDWVFISMPIYSTVEHVLLSKHFKPNEHVWYWTETGLVLWMLESGFLLKARDCFETQLGREDIGTFAFRRVVE